MLELESQLDLLKDVIKHPNVAELLSEKDLDSIANQVIHEYNIDLESRAEWEEKNEEALKLALQVVEMKTDPWPDCANIKFPLVTVAAMQGHAREYPALIYGTEPVKCRVIGKDEDGLKTMRAERVSAHMSYQILEEDTNWEDQMDRVLFTKFIVGSAFKKIYFDPSEGHNVSEAVLAQDLVIPYKSKSLEKAVRLTHKIPLSRNDIYERVARGYYLDVINPITQEIPKTEGVLEKLSDDIQGQHRVDGDDDVPFVVLEQHRYLDLDGDGYAEPYIVTVSEQSQKVLRIVARFYKDGITYGEDKQILHIDPQRYFVKYGMLPSPDGGIYDLGFGALLGPLNHTVNTVLNQLLDAGTLRALGGGFLGRGARLRRGQNQFRPGEFKQTDSTNIRNDIVPIPTPQPDNVAFALLGLIIQYGEKISGATDIMTGQNIGQNTPANTALELVKQGSVVFNNIFKRTYRSLRDEFRLMYKLNQVYLTQNKHYDALSGGTNPMIMAKDYMGPDTDIKPSADPNVAGVEKRMQQAIFLKQASMQGPGYVLPMVEKRLLEAAGITNLNEVWNAQGPMPLNPKVQIEQLKIQQAQQKLDGEMKLKLIALLQDNDKVKAEIQELQARAAKEYAEAKGVDTGHTISLINSQIQAKKYQMEGNLKAADIIQKVLSTMTPQIGDTSGTIQSPIQQRGTAPLATPSGYEGGFAIPSIPSTTVNE